MPEGDSLRRARLRVAPVLVGKQLDHVWFRKLRGHRPRTGQTVLAVEAVGKHLLIEFDRNLTLQTHLGMTGSWRAAPPDADVDRLHADPKLRVRLSTSAGHALCYAAPTIRTFVRGRDPDPTAHLGPDLADDGVDVDEVVSRARSLFPPSGPLADLLLDQRVAAGIGNVFKSEALHRRGLFPFTPVAAVDDGELRRLYRTASDQIRRNSLDPHRRRSTTLGGGDYFVYERWRKPCRRCTMPIERSYGGADGRSTYWCPRCQPEAGQRSGG